MVKTFSARVNAIFADMNADYDAMFSLMTDVALGREIIDNGIIIPKAEANRKILEFSHRVLEIGEDKSPKAIRRALEKNGREWFAVIEDVVDNVIETGLQESEWFETLVERKNLNYYDRQDFYIDTDAILAVGKAGVSHHNHALQRLGRGRTISLTPELYVVKVGADLNRFIVGQEDWNRLVGAIAIAFMKQIQGEVYDAVDTAATQLPVSSTDFVNTGVLSASTKAKFDAIVANVGDANPGASEVIIMGTMPALQALNELEPISWISDIAKDSRYNLGRMGLYQGTRLVQIDNRYKDKTYTNKVFSDKKLLIVPAIGDAGRFVKMIDEGQTEIERTERGDFTSDLMTMEVQRRFGIGVVIGHQFGQWSW